MKKRMAKSLARWLVDETNTDGYRAGTLTGQKHPTVDSSLIDAVGGLRSLIVQAKEMEQDPLLKEKIKFDWRDMGADIQQIHYDVDILEELCKREGIPDPRAHQKEMTTRINRWRDAGADNAWLRAYYDDLLRRLSKGKIVQEAEDEMLFQCLNAVAAQSEFVWERVFSARVLRNSKRFHNEYRDRIFTILKNYSPYYEDGMSKDELFDMHNIHSYAQILEWKGALCYQIDGELHVDTSVCRYGTVLNAQTMEHSVPVLLPDCKRIMTIENKANYMDMQYHADTLYIFCHGYFTPKEVRFLKGIPELVGDDCEFLHWGDMDYGGISIFQFLKHKVFPKVKPYRMGVEDFRRALEAGGGIRLEESTRKKLEAKDAGELAPLKQEILKSGQIIEQEMLEA